ncbi:MAG: replicative DNA helicase [Treponema sp.]|nr:replicative DNA helicase [Treponema sp.]
MAEPSGKSRIPPHNDDAERAVIGAMLIDDSAITIAQQYLEADDFYAPRHRKIFTAVLNLFRHGTRPDLLTLSSELEQKGKLDEAGGIDYIASLTHAVPSSANTEYYAQIVQKHSLRRGLIKISGEAGARAYDETVEPRHLLEEAQQKLFDISDPRRMFRYKKVGDTVKDVYNYLDTIYRTRPDYTGIPTGFKELDNITSGFQPAELIVIGARPGMGKTAIALSMAANISIRQNIPAAFFSLEMADQALMLRLISSESGVDSLKLKSGYFQKSDFPNIFNAMEILHDAPLHIVDMPNMTILNIQAMSRMLKVKEKVEIIFIDYIGLITSDNKMLPRWELISEVSRALKGLARELNIPVVALSQLRREAENQTPGLADIRESGSIEQDADMVMFINRDRELDKSVEEQSKDAGQKVQLLIAKNRNGPVGSVDLTFLKKLTKFVPFAEERR